MTAAVVSRPRGASPSTVLRHLHPKSRATAAALAVLRLPDGWTAAARVCGGFTLHGAGREWAVSPVNDRADLWSCIETRHLGVRQPTSHETAQAAVDALAAVYQSQRTLL